MWSLCIGTQSRAIRKVEILRASHGSFLLCAFYKCTFLKFMITCTVKTPWNLEVLSCRTDAPRPLPPVYGNNYTLKYPWPATLVLYSKPKLPLKFPVSVSSLPLPSVAPNVCVDLTQSSFCSHSPVESDLLFNPPPGLQCHGAMVKTLIRSKSTTRRNRITGRAASMGHHQPERAWSRNLLHIGKRPWTSVRRVGKKIQVLETSQRIFTVVYKY